LVGAAVGAGIGAGVGAAVAASQKKPEPKPGINALNQKDVTNLITKLQGNPNAASTIATLKKYSTTQPVALVTTGTKQSVVVAQLQPPQLAKAAEALKQKPGLFKGQDVYVLQAMGINPMLAVENWSPGISPFAPGITPPPPTTAATDALSAANAKVAAANAKSTASQQALTAAQAKLSLAQAQATTTKAQAQAAYAAAVAKANVQNQAAVTAYNAALKQNAPQIAKAYNTSVAQENIELSLHSKGPTPLLHMSVTQAYNSNKQTYTPISSTLPST